MSSIRWILCITVVLSWSGCEPNSEGNTKRFSDQTSSTYIQGSVRDSVVPPIVTEITTERIVKLGSPQTFQLFSFNKHLDTPQQVDVTIEQGVQSGDAIKEAEEIIIKDSAVVAQFPNRVPAKDPYVKDKNTGTFFSFNELHGLGSNIVFDIAEEHNGRLWLGTANAGVVIYDGTHFIRYSDQHGLGSLTVLDILHDKEDQTWLGTATAGLVQFDGTRFIHRNPVKQRKIGYVWCVMEDRKGNIWFGTQDDGLYKYDGKKYYRYGVEQGLKSNTVTALCEDGSGVLWIGTQHGGLHSFNGTEINHYNDSAQVGSGSIHSLYEDRGGVLWIGTAKHGVYYKKGADFFRYTIAQGLPSNDIRTVTMDRDHKIWLGFAGGGVSYFSDSLLVTYDQTHGMPSNVVWNLHADRYGKIWMGTNDGGLVRYDGATFQNFSESDGLPNANVFAAAKHPDGSMWFGTRGGGLIRVKEGLSQVYGPEQGLPAGMITSLLVDRGGNLWIGSRGAGVFKLKDGQLQIFDVNTGLGNNNVFSLLEDKSGNIWMGTFGGGLSKFDGTRMTRYTKEQGLPGNVIMALHEDHQGKIWIGTFDGLSCFDGKRFTNYDKTNGLANNTILAITSDASHNLWIGTQGGGVGVMKENRITWINENNGLLSNVVNALYLESDSVLWLGMRSGLAAMHTGRINFGSIRDAELSLAVQSNVITYTYEDGFIGMNVNGGKTIAGDNNGTIWVGALNKLMRVNSKNARQKLPDLRPAITALELYNEQITWQNYLTAGLDVIKLSNGIELHDIQVNHFNQRYAVPEEVSLPYDNNFVTIRFIAPSSYRKRQVRYVYRLEGLDDAWSTPVNSNFAHYGNLSPNTYTFRLRTIESGRMGNEEATMVLVVRPPWWQTWWFRIVALILITAGAVGFYRYRTASLRRRQRELEQTVAERTSEVIVQKEKAEQQRILVEHKQRELLDSINYARNLQHATLVPLDTISRYLPESFVLYKPKDIVAGDFYFFETTDDYLFVAAADCTGHGVPGAMVSIVCSNALTRCVRELNISDPGEILNTTRKLVIETFDKSGEDVKDGMDISLLVINRKSKQALWAGANNPLWIFPDKFDVHYAEANSEVCSDKVEGLVEIKGDKQPVGRYEFNFPFVTHDVTRYIKNGAAIYLFTDGIADQFGGPKGKKMKYKKFAEIIANSKYEQSEKQHDQIALEFELWKGDLEQVDDVCLIGLQIP